MRSRESHDNTQGYKTEAEELGFSGRIVKWRHHLGLLLAATLMLNTNPLRADEDLNRPVQAGDLSMSPQQWKQFIGALNTQSIEYNRGSGESSYKGHPLLAVREKDFNAVFFSDAFQDYLKNKAGSLSVINAFSMAQAVARSFLKNDQPLNDDNLIRFRIMAIDAEREKIKKREIFGPNTKLILITHGESKFRNERIINEVYLRSGGKEENIVLNTKGALEKEKILRVIRENKGATTIVFSGHGNASHLLLDGEKKKKKQSIDTRELGDALNASGNVPHTNFIDLSCDSYLFTLALQERLQEELVAVTESEEGRPSYMKFTKDDEDNQLSRLLSELIRVKIPGETIKMGDVIEIQGSTWKIQIPTIWKGIQIGAISPKPDTSWKTGRRA